MKKILIGILILLALIAFLLLANACATLRVVEPQTYDTIHQQTGGVRVIDGDTAYWDDFNLCKERGHVKGEVIMITDAYCPPYLTENDSVSIMIYPGCNTITYTCQRCGKIISEPEKEIKVIIWKR